MSETQIDILSDFIMANVKGEPSRSEGAGDTAVRIIEQLQASLQQIAEHRVLVRDDEGETEADAMARVAKKALD